MFDREYNPLFRFKRTARPHEPSPGGSLGLCERGDVNGQPRSRITSIVAQPAAAAGSGNSAGSCNGSPCHHLTSGSTCLTKHLRLRSASSYGIPP
jgi:hypothetical protein